MLDIELLIYLFLFDAEKNSWDIMHKVTNQFQGLSRDWQRGVSGPVYIKHLLKFGQKIVELAKKWEYSVCGDQIYNLSLLYAWLPL